VAVRQFVAPGLTVPPGEVLIPTDIGDPVHGALPCPAAPLVAGTLQRRGKRFGHGPAGQCTDPSGDEGGAVLFAATCQLRDGATAAVAAAASPADRVAVAEARSAVDEWSAVFGTRRLLAGPSPWCSGAVQALGRARQAAAGRPTVHIYGQLAAGPDAMSELAAQGAVFVGSLDEVPDGAAVLFPAHGVPAEVLARAAARGLDVVDATCPLVRRVHAEAAKFAERGDDLVLIGQPGHMAVPGITGQAPGRTTLASTPASTAALRVADPRQVSYLLQPGIPLEDSAPVVAALRSRFPALRGPHPDGFCYAASDRAATVRAIAAASDVMFVLGAPDSADSRQISTFARGCGAHTHIIATPGDIVPAMLNGASTIGLAESTSASPALAGQVAGALSGLGPLSVATRRVTTDVTGEPGVTGVTGVTGTPGVTGEAATS
jgi:4-hydroxy-3-methylbut-2-en-1-yl diphosphate reductase